MKNILTGKIIAAKMQETATVLIERTKKHSKYKKQFKISKKYLAHNPKNIYKEGDKVIMEQTKPISKRKTFIITEKVKD